MFVGLNARISGNTGPIRKIISVLDKLVIEEGYKIYIVLYHHAKIKKSGVTMKYYYIVKWGKIIFILRASTVRITLNTIFLISLRPGIHQRNEK